MNITELEKKVMQGILRSEFNDGSEKSHPIWSWSIRADGVAKKSIPGVVASLAKKGLAICDGEGKESCVCLSDEGMKMLAASAVRQPESWLSRARSVDTTTPVEIAREQRRIKARRLMRTAVDDRGKTWLMPTAKSIAMNRDPAEVEKKKASLENFLASRPKAEPKPKREKALRAAPEKDGQGYQACCTKCGGIAQPRKYRSDAVRFRREHLEVAANRNHTVTIEMRAKGGGKN